MGVYMLLASGSTKVMSLPFSEELSQFILYVFSVVAHQFCPESGICVVFFVAAMRHIVKTNRRRRSELPPQQIIHTSHELVTNLK